MKTMFSCGIDEMECRGRSSSSPDSENLSLQWEDFFGPPVELAPSLLNMFDTMAANNTERRFSEDSQAESNLDTTHSTTCSTNEDAKDKESAPVEDNGLTTKMKRLSENIDTYIDADAPDTIVSDIIVRPLSCSSTCSSASSASTTSRTSLGNKKHLVPCSSLDSQSVSHQLQIDEENSDCLPSDLKLKMDYDNKEFSNSLSSAASGRSSQDLTYIDRVIQEVLETERTYVKDLSEIIEGYLYHIRNNSDVRASAEELKVLFGNIEAIYRFNKSFLEELEESEEDPVQIAQCFVKHNEGFASYTKYCTNYPRTVSVLTELMRRKETADMFKERQAKLRHGLPLGSYLLKPVQRILKYHLFLQNILKHYDKEKPGYEDILKALSTMTGIAKHINDMKRKHEHAVRVQEIQSLLYDWEGQDLTTYGELVLEGSFRIVGAKALRQMFLFDKVLLIVKKKEDGTFSCKAHITCDNLMLIESVPGEPLSFHVIPFDNPRLQYTVQARTLEQKKEWTLQLKRLILENYGVNIPLHARQLVMELELKEPEGSENRPDNIKRQYSAPEYLLDKRKQRRKSESSLNKALKMKKATFQGIMGTKKGDVTSPKSSPPTQRRQAISREASPTHKEEASRKPERRKSEPGPQVSKLQHVDINITRKKPPENKPVPLAEGEDGDDEDEEEDDDDSKAILLESANGAKSFDDACPRAKRMSLVLEEEGLDALNPNLGWDPKILHAVMSSITVKKAETIRSAITQSLPTSPQRAMQRSHHYDDDHIYDNLTFNNSTRHANSTSSVDIKPRNHSSGEYVTLVFAKNMPQVIHNVHAKSNDSLDISHPSNNNSHLGSPKTPPRKQNNSNGNLLLKQWLSKDQRSLSDPNGDLDKPGRWHIPKSKRIIGQYDNLTNIWRKSQGERQGNSDSNLQNGTKIEPPVRRVNSFNNSSEIKKTSIPTKMNFQATNKSLVFSNALALQTPESPSRSYTTSVLSQHASHQKTSVPPSSDKSGSLPRSFEICRESSHPRCGNCFQEPATSSSSDTFHSEPCSPHKQPIYENVRMRSTSPSRSHYERPVTIASDKPHVNPEFLHDFENYIKNSPSPKTSPVNRFPVHRDETMHSSYSNTPSDSSEHLHSHSTSSSTEGLVSSIRHVIANVGSRIANIKANISPHSDFWGHSTEDESQEDLRETRKHKEKERRVNKLIYSLARAYGQMIKLKHKYKNIDAKESERIATQLTALLEENKQGGSAIGARMARPIELDYSIPRQRPPRPKKQSKDSCVRPDSIVSETSNFTISGEGESASRESRVSLGIGTSVTSDSSPNLDEVDESGEQEHGLEGSSDSSGLSADSYCERSFEALENFLENEMFRDSAIYSDPEDLDAMFLVAAESKSLDKEDEVEIEDICEDEDPETKAIIHETVKTFEEKIKPLIINKLEIKAKVRSQGILDRLKILEENTVYRKEAASPEMALSPELPIKSIRERWKELEDWSKGVNRQTVHIEEQNNETKVNSIETKTIQDTKDQALAKGWVKLVVGKFQGDSEA